MRFEGVMTHMKQLPIGVQDFKSIRNKNKYFVDKSMLIGQILDLNDGSVFLCTRPRRFGKSLNLSMMDAFFNIEYKGNTWFDDLEISKHHEYDGYKNAFPVIFIDLKISDVSSFDRFVGLFNKRLYRLFRQYLYLVESPKLCEGDKNLFKRLYDGEKTIEDSESALTDLCSMLETHHGKKVVVLIDEYDNAFNSVTDGNLRREILSFMKEVFTSLLKGNSSLQMGVVTGVMQITKENIFSGLNNLVVNNIFTKRSDEMFGFTDDEVKQICEDYEHPGKFTEAKEWYDGYRFGDADIYNPWSILNYVENGFEPGSYWVNTSGNSIIKDLLSHADDDTIKDLEALGSGENLIRNITATLTFDELYSSLNSIYSLMVISGYLKAIPVGNKYNLSIPNKELYNVFAGIIIDSSFTDGVEASFSDFADAVISNDIPLMERMLYTLMADTISSRILDNEHSYQAFIVGMLMALSGRYKITADFESGNGYHDIVMKCKDGKGYNIVMELKKSKSKSQLEQDAKEAIQQIREKDYAHGLEGQTILYGISFYGKEPHIASEML